MRFSWFEEQYRSTTPSTSRIWYREKGETHGLGTWSDYTHCQLEQLEESVNFTSSISNKLLTEALTDQHGHGQRLQSVSKHSTHPKKHKP